MTTNTAETPSFPTGRQSVEISQGYKPLPKKETEAPAELTKAEGAELNAANHNSNEVKVISIADELPDNTSLTVEQAADALTDARVADATDAEKLATDDDAAFAAGVDKLRGVTELAPPPPLEPEFDLAAAMEKSPKLKAELEANLQHAETMRAQHGKAIAEAGRIGLSGLLAVAPELGQVDPSQWEGVLRNMAQTNPQKFNAAVGQLRTLQQVENAHTEWKAGENRAFNDWGRSQDAEVSAHISKVPAAQRNVIAQEVASMFADYGLSAQDVQALAATPEGKMIRQSGVQRLLWDLAAFRVESRGKPDIKSLKAELGLDVPPVTRPGQRSGAGFEAPAPRLRTSYGSDSKGLAAAAEYLTARRSRR